MMRSVQQNILGKTPNLIQLELSLVEIKKVNQTLNHINATRYKSYEDFRVMREKYDDNFNLLSQKTPFSLQSQNNVMTNNNTIRFNSKLDYRNFNSLSDFTDDAIKHNLDFGISIDPGYITSKKNSLYYAEVRHNSYEYLKNIRDLCEKGDYEGFCMANTLPFEPNTDVTDEFNGLVYGIKNKMFILAQSQKKFPPNLGALQMFDIHNRILNKPVPDNVYIDKNSVNLASTKNKQSFTHYQEIAIASNLAYNHPQLVFYVCLDRTQQDIQSWLNSLGYVEIQNDHIQIATDLVIIDPLTKRYKITDIKNCSISNMEKFFPINSRKQLVIFTGRATDSDVEALKEQHKYFHMCAFKLYISDPTVKIEERNEAQAEYSRILKVKSSDPDNVDPLISKTSIIVLNDF